VLDDVGNERDESFLAEMCAAANELRRSYRDWIDGEVKALVIMSRVVAAGKPRSFAKGVRRRAERAKQIGAEDSRKLLEELETVVRLNRDSKRTDFHNVSREFEELLARLSMLVDELLEQREALTTLSPSASDAT
jgi:hypothetical protein